MTGSQRDLYFWVIVR